MSLDKEKIITWIILVLIIVICFGALFYFKKDKTPVTPAEVAEEIKRPSKSFAKKELTPEEKENLDNSALNEALKTGGANSCAQIKFDEKLRKQCEDGINFTKFIKGGNEHDCQKLHDANLRQQCFDKIYYNAAIEDQSIKLCEKINDTTLKQNCLDKVQAYLGRNAKNADDCKAIINPQLKQNCLDNFYLSKSVKSLEVDKCKNINDAELQKECTQTVKHSIKVKEENKKYAVREYKSNTEMLTECDKLNDEKSDKCKDDANFNLALEKKDLSYCNAIDDEDKKQKCIGEQSNNISRFYLRQAIVKKDSSLCNKITDVSLRQTCVVNAR